MTDINQFPQDGPLTTEGIDDGALTSPASPTEEAAPPTRKINPIVRKLAWIAFGAFCLILFTLIKLPEDRIKGYVQGMIASQLAPKGITFSAERGYISIGWGISYIMKGVTLNFPPPQPATRIDKITVTPSLLPMIFGYQGGNLRVENGDGLLRANFSVKNTQVSASFKAKEMDLGKLGVLPLAAGIRGTAMVTGEASIYGDFSVPSTLGGDGELSLSKIVLDPQSIQGFSVPRLSISEGKVEFAIDKAKATIKTFRLGKPGSAADDIQASGTGDIMLGRNWDSSTLNAKVTLKLSEQLMKSFILLDAILGAGKQADGSYAFQLTGPLLSPNPVPVTAGGK